MFKNNFILSSPIVHQAPEIKKNTNIVQAGDQASYGFLESNTNQPVSTFSLLKGTEHQLFIFEGLNSDEQFEKLESKLRALLESYSLTVSIHLISEDYFMKNQSSHNFTQWLYKTKTFTSFYGQAAGEASSIVFWQKLKEEFLDFIPEGGRILEIGSGPGLQAIKVLKHRPDVVITASDFSSEMVFLGNKNYQELILRDEKIRGIQSHLSFVQADVMDLSQFSDEAFDGIYSLTAIKHFPDPIRGLNECIGILKPGGRMFFSEFFAEASIADMVNLAKHVKIPNFLKPIIPRLVHIATKNEAPKKADVEKWRKELCSNGLFFSENLQGYPFFILKFEKAMEQQKKQLISRRIY